MKKPILILAMIFAAGFAFGNTSRFYDDSGKLIREMHVSSKEGLNVRIEPKLSSKKIGALTCCELAEIHEIGKEETIDGITAPWVKLNVLDQGFTVNGEYAEYGWVFGGYLTREIPVVSEKILLPQIREKGYMIARSYLISTKETKIYPRCKKWQIDKSEYTRELPDISGSVKDNTVTRECMAFGVPTAIITLPKGANVTIKNMVETPTETGEYLQCYGIRNGVLFPVYWCEWHSGEHEHSVAVCGIDLFIQDIPHDEY